MDRQSSGLGKRPGLTRLVRGKLAREARRTQLDTAEPEKGWKRRRPGETSPEEGTREERSEQAQALLSEGAEGKGNQGGRLE